MIISVDSEYDNPYNRLIPSKNTNYLIGIIIMTTFTQINKLAIQCQDIVVEYNKDAVEYGFDKVEMKSTDYYELLIAAMLSAGATITDIKVNHVQIALGKFPKDDKEVKAKTVKIDGRKEYQHFADVKNNTYSVKKIDKNCYTLYENKEKTMAGVTKKDIEKRLTSNNAIKINNTI